MNVKILIADDSATNRLLLSATISRLGHKADIVASGVEALHNFQREDYDLVFLDLNMPLMDGIVTAREIQKINKRGTPVYALTGGPTPEQESRLAETGIKRCIIKPLDREKIQRVFHESGLGTLPSPAHLPDHLPDRLLHVYAAELRARGKACADFAQQGDIPSLMHETHTLRALAAMLQTHYIEEAASELEAACAHPDKPRFFQYLRLVETLCDKTAGRLEEQKKQH